MSRVFISDCEGPISKNDNAFELAAHFIPEGTKLFTVISKYDDVLADVVRRSGYNAGDTLKLILPFLKAYDVTDQKMRGFSERSLALVSGAKEALRYIREIAPTFIISASYEHYIKALCQALAFPLENIYCTKLKMDKYTLTDKDRARLKKIAKEIAEMPVVEIPPGAESLKGFSGRDRDAIRRLDEIFWDEIARMTLGRIFSEVNPIGGGEKARVVQSIVRKLGVSLAGVMYVGDSITDEEAFKLVKESDGLTVAFNGNQYAVENAEIAVLSRSSLVTALVADVFCRLGKQQALELVRNWNRKKISKSQANPKLVELFFKLHPERLPKVKIVTSENIRSLAEESTDFRKKARGEAIGRLG